MLSKSGLFFRCMGRSTCLWILHMWKPSIPNPSPALPAVLSRAAPSSLPIQLNCHSGPLWVLNNSQSLYHSFLPLLALLLLSSFSPESPWNLLYDRWSSSGELHRSFGCSHLLFSVMSRPNSCIHLCLSFIPRDSFFMSVWAIRGEHHKIEHRRQFPVHVVILGPFVLAVCIMNPLEAANHACSMNSELLLMPLMSSIWNSREEHRSNLMSFFRERPPSRWPHSLDQEFEMADYENPVLTTYCVPPIPLSHCFHDLRTHCDFLLCFQSNTSDTKLALGLWNRCQNHCHNES